METSGKMCKGNFFLRQGNGTKLLSVTGYVTGSRSSGWSGSILIYYKDEVRRQFPSFETGRELQELFIAARLSSIAYGEDRNIPHQLRDAARHPWFSPSEFQKSLDKSPQKLFLMTDETTLYVTFCGTQSLTDLFVDLSATLSPSSLLSGALVHHGFAGRLERTPWRSIAAAAEQFKTQKRLSKPRIVLCGHSLAGAIAQLVALCLLVHYRNAFDIHCFAFGQPLVGDLTPLIAENKWQQHFHSIIHVRDPVPFILRDTPRMMPMGNLLLLSDNETTGDVEFGVITPEIFKRHKWSTSDASFNVRSLAKMLDLVDQASSLKRSHSMEHYDRLLHDLLRGHEHLFKKQGTRIPIRENKALVPPPTVTECRGKFLDNGDLEIFLQGTHLEQFIVATLVVHDKPDTPPKLQTKPINSYRVATISSTRAEVCFVIPKGTRLNSSKATIQLSDYFTLVQHKCVLPFNFVWLIGKTGAGKSQLRFAFEELSNPSPAPPSPDEISQKDKGKAKPAPPPAQVTTRRNAPRAHVVPEAHKDFDRSYEHNKIHYYEFNGFTEYDERDTKSFAYAFENTAPRLILLIINTAETIRNIEKEVLLELINLIRAQENIPIWFVFTHYSMVDDRIRDGVIDQIKAELDIRPTDPVFTVDSVPFRAGGFELPAQGVTELQEAMEHFITTNPTLLSEEFHYRNLWPIVKTIATFAWRKKGSLIGVVTAVVGLYGYMRSRL